MLRKQFAGEGTRADLPSEDIEISWDIEITEAAEGQEQTDDKNGSSHLAAAEQQDETQLKSWPQSVLRLSQDGSFRTAVLDDLHELQSFLLQQIHELSSGEVHPHNYMG